MQVSTLRTEQYKAQMQIGNDQLDCCAAEKEAGEGKGLSGLQGEYELIMCSSFKKRLIVYYDALTGE